ncbi:MAG: DNA integrity scanning protein DisA [Coriobacteriia bacterium]|nr:DNA integrity scanning protein DisA [Coriobacteriia bacterium]
MHQELEKVAPGTRLREGLDMILSARTGALIVMGDTDAVDELCDGGFVIDTPFSPQRLFELAKMDGAIILDEGGERIIRANVHLVPDSSLLTTETGMRHRTAERVSRQTHALVLSVSQRREVVSLYLRGRRVALEDIEVVLAKANQALQTLQNYRTRLDEVLDRLTHLEFYDLVTIGNVAEAVGRFEMVRRVSKEVTRYIAQLGTDGRLIRMQADELTANVEDQYLLLTRDYAADPSLREAASLLGRFAELPLERLLESDAVAHELGLDAIDRAEQHVYSRGYRVLAQLPALPAGVTNRLVARFDSLPGIMKASSEQLDEVDGVGTRRAKAIASGLMRLKAHSEV